MSLLFSVLLAKWNWLQSGGGAGIPPGYGPVIKDWIKCVCYKGLDRKCSL